MKRKTYRPFDFSQSLDVAPTESLDEAVAQVTAEPARAETAQPRVAADSDAAEPQSQPLARKAENTPRPTSNQRAISDLRMSRPTPPVPAKAGGQRLYFAALIVSVLWIAAPVAFYIATARGGLPFNQPLMIAILTLLAIGPVGLIWVLAFVLNQGVRLAAEARFAHAQADDMIRPAAIAAAGAGGAAEMIRHEIESAVAAAGQARHELITLREVLASETANLVEAAASSARTAASLMESVGAERRELSALTTVLEAQVEGVEGVIARQSQLVSQTADLVDAQIREAGALLDASTNVLATAASEASNAARTAGEDLGRQVSRLEAAAGGVVEQVQSVEDTLSSQRAALMQAASDLRAEQEDFGLEVQDRQTQLSAILSQVRSAASEINDSAQSGGDALRVLVENAADRFRDIGEAVAEERSLFGADMVKSLGAIADAARTERDQMIGSTQESIEALSAAALKATEAARLQGEAARQSAQEGIDAINTAAAKANEAAQTHGDATRLKVDQLSEAAFAAGQQADAAFEARLAQARALIEQSANLVEDAGVRAGERLANGLEAARTTVDKLETLLQEVEARTARLPADAEERSAQVKAVVEQGVEQLLGAARRAADETQAIDAAFQQRVHRNYEMLSEAVRLMGAVSGQPAPERHSRPAPTLAPPPVFERPAYQPDPQPAPALIEPPVDLALPPVPVSITQRPDFEPVTPRAADVAPVETPTAEALSLRPRLKLTPEAIDEQVFAPFDADNAPPPATEPGERNLTWKQILSSADEPDADVDGDTTVIEEIRLLGIDPNALLPRSRIDEIAPMLRSGDRHGAREVVRQLAPAAMRRLSRNVLADKELRDRVSDMIGVFDARLSKAIASDSQGFGVANLLASEEGRVFLLIDSAVSDLL